MWLTKLATKGIANPIIFFAAIVIYFTILRHTIFLRKFLFRFTHICPCEAIINDAQKFVAKYFIKFGFDRAFSYELISRVGDVRVWIVLLDLHLYYKINL